MTRGINRPAWLALGLMAVLAASPGPPLHAQDLVPVGYWALDDGLTDPYTITAVDSSANGNNGTLVNFPEGFPTWRPGAYGGALKLDGIDDRVDMGTMATALDITGALSTSFWMGRLGTNGSDYAVLAGKNFSGGSVNDAYYVHSMADSRVVFGIAPAVGDPVELASSITIPNGSWHHVATTFDPGNRMAIYVDGVLNSELTTGVPTEVRSVPTSPFTLGNLGQGSTANRAFNGYLDEVRVFNGVLGVPQIQTLAVPPSTVIGDPTAANLVAHWKLDDGQADPATTIAVDSTASPSNGNLVNFDAPPAWEAGQVDGALRFDGTNDRLDVPFTGELDITGDLSMAFWIKPNGSGASKYGPLVGKNVSGGATGDCYFTDIVYTRSVTDAVMPSGTIEFVITKNNVNYVARSNSALSITDDKWRHIAVTYDDGSRMAIYIDGELDAELAIEVPDSCDSQSFGNLAIGNLVSATTDKYSFRGLFDDVQLYTGVLTAQQIRDMVPEVPTVPGDATGDGFVDQADAAVLAANWGATVSGGFGSGDFNADNVVNAADASIMAANWNPAPPAEAAGVPEPAALVLLAAGLVGLVMRRHRP